LKIHFELEQAVYAEGWRRELNTKEWSILEHVANNRGGLPAGLLSQAMTHLNSLDGLGPLTIEVDRGPPRRFELTEFGRCVYEGTTLEEVAARYPELKWSKPRVRRATL
jgi:hypothetical protein